MGAREDHRWQAKRKRVLGAAGTILADVSLISRQATSSIVSEEPTHEGRMGRRAFPTGSGGALGTIAAGSAGAQPAASLPAGFVRLRVVPGELTVDGKVGKAYRIEREDGRLGWVGRRGGRFQVALDNGLADPLSIHWHGLILPDGQDGVPYVTQPPIKPGERRLYDLPPLPART